ncbi:MAG: YceI family protein [Bacteroidota bacterium]|nr:YceI family protein [Bacteroidota bacterium]
MKRFNKILMIVLIFISGYGLVASCTHKNDPLPAAVSTAVKISRGTHVHLAGVVLGDTSQWKFDKVHSAVNWSSPFLEVGADLTGKFNQFGIADLKDAMMLNYITTKQPVPDTSWAFYENEPAKTHFAGYIQTNQVNTGEPGRDGGCLITTFGTTKIVAGTQNLTAANVARIKTTSVAFDAASSGYIVTFDFTWQVGTGPAVTQSIVGKLSYVPETLVPGTTNSEFGLKLEFQINKADFGIINTEVADKVSIVVNANFNNK